MSKNRSADASVSATGAASLTGFPPINTACHNLRGAQVRPEVPLLGNEPKSLVVGDCFASVLLRRAGPFTV